MTETPPAGLTVTALSGTGWTCTVATRTCTRADALAPSASYPDITVTANIAADAVGTLVEQCGGIRRRGFEPRQQHGVQIRSIITTPAAGSDLTLAKSAQEAAPSCRGKQSRLPSG